MRLTLSIALILLSFSVCAQQEIKLYDGVAPGSEGVANNEKVQRDANGRIQNITGVVEPSITVFLPSAEKSTGIAVILCSGGALAAHSWGDNVISMAEWLNECGIAAIGLKYRTRTSVGPRPLTSKPLNVTITEFDKLEKSNANPDQSGATDNSIENAINDALRAMEIVRQNADKWHIDTTKIGYLGFSAGGGVGLGAVLRADSQHRAAFIATVYGPSLIDVDVPKNAPKLFIATRVDHKNVAAGLLSLYLDWKKAGANAEMHFYDDGAGPFVSGDMGNTCGTWRENFYRWLKFNF